MQGDFTKQAPFQPQLRNERAGGVKYESTCKSFRQILASRCRNFSQNNYMEASKIILNNLKVIFFNLEDEGFGLSVTVDATDEAVQNKIKDWYETNSIGKDNDPEKGKPKFKDYTNEKTGVTTKQFSFKYNEFTKFAGLNGLTKENIGFDAVIDVVANAFTFDNKFGKGIGQSLSAVVVKEGGKTGADSDMAYLMSSMSSDEKKEDVPFEDKM